MIKKNTNILRMICGCLLLMGSLWAQAETFTLEQCIETALKNNLSLQTGANNYQSSRIQYQQSLTNISPSVYAGANQGWSFGRSEGADGIISSRNASSTSFNLGASLTLFDGLAMKFAVDQARANMQATEAELAVQELQIKLSVMSLYLQVMLQKQMKEVADSALSESKRTLHKDSLLVAAQRMAEGELYAIEAQVAQEELQVVQAENMLRMALLDLAQAMNVSTADGFDIVSIEDDQLQGTLVGSADEVYQEALAYRPELRAQEYAITANEAALKRAKAGYSPTLSLSAGVGSNYYKMGGMENASFADQMSDNVSGSVGLNLSVPIYDKMATPNAVKQQKLAVDNARIQLEQRKQNLRKEIEQAYYDAVSAYSELESARKSERSTHQAMVYAEQKYDAGRSSAYDYTTAKTTYLKAISARLRAEYTYYFRLRVLQFYQGRL